MRLVYENNPEYLANMDFNALHELLNPIQDKIAPEYVKAYPGLSNLLSYLGKEGISFAVFTSGTPHHIVRNFGVSLPELGKTDFYLDKTHSDLEKLYIYEEAIQYYFAIPQVTFVTCDVVSASKPDPESLLLALERLHVSKDEVLVLDDHFVDMQAGVNANIVMRIGVSHGFDDMSALEKGGATKVIDSLDALVGLLKNRV